jgi:hypothetical protein
MGGPRCHREGHFAIGGPLQGLGPEFEKGIVITVPNTGTYTCSTADLQTLLSGTESAELMVGVTPMVKNNVTHDGNAVTAVLRNGDRIVLRAMEVGGGGMKNAIDTGDKPRFVVFGMVH